MAMGVLALLGLLGFKIALERLVDRYPFEPERALGVGQSRIFTDRFGESIFAELSPEGQWRLPVRLSEMSTNLTLATLALEDKRFWRHKGVDWLAGGRSVVANLRNQDIVTGASTLSMQLARLLYPEPRSVGRKLRQIARAIDMERQFPKDWILEQYLNHAPYGGNLVGVEAASRYYFRESAKDLDVYQAALLAGIPQRPAALRPDRHLERALRRRQVALGRMADLGWIRTEIAEANPEVHLAPTPLNEDGARIGTRQREPVYATSVMAQAGRASIDLRIQNTARQTLERGIDRTPHAQHGAMVVIDNASNEALAVVGSLGIHHPEDNWVNAALAPRSPGSALKPFIYLAALDSGRLIPETLVWDGPLVNREYRPENFDGAYRGWIPARDALSLSLNTPAVRLLHQIGPDPLLATLRDCGLKRLERTADETGLALALGGVETTLLELTGAYAGLARGGLFQEPITQLGQSKDDAPEPLQPFSTGSIRLLRRMLSAAPLPGASGEPVCWKTGTSSGARDAWCLAFNPEITVGVWIGNKSGAPAPGSSGATTAAPIVADFLGAFYQQRPRPIFPGRDDGLEAIEICAETGLRARPQCQERRRASAVIGSPLRPCRDPHADTESVPTSQSPTILSPKERPYFALHGTAPTIALRAEPKGPFRWFHNGKLLEQEGHELEQAFDVGAHQLICVAPDGRASAPVRFEVR